MEQDVALAKVNETMNLANQTNSKTLGNLVILSALITEFFVADILAAEADTEILLT